MSEQPKAWKWDARFDTPRDLVGYGPNPPHPQWPRNCKLALSIVINYEEGGEYSVLNNDAHSESYLTEAPGGEAKQHARSLNAESQYDYGARAGIWRLLKVFTKAGIKGTVYGVGKALQDNPEVARRCVDAGWEVGAHGWRWIDYHDMPVEDERREIERNIDVIQQQTGQAPKGWYIGRLSPRSHTLIHQIYEERGLPLLWLSDSYADDLPYYKPLPAAVDPSGTETQLVLPYTLDNNDFKFLTANNWSHPDDFFHYLKAAFDELYAEGEDLPKMMSVGLHARISGKPGRVGAVRKFVDYVMSKDDVWIATREEIARHCLETHPPSPNFSREE